MSDSYYASSWMGLIFTGFAVLWSLQIIYRGHRARTHGSQFPLLLNTIGWLLVFAGILGPLATIGPAFALLLVPVVLVVAAMAVQRFRLLEFRMLSRELALALEKGIPLERAARSFALERADEVGDRAAQLAEDLAQGIRLETAMRRARIPVPFELGVAARLGPAPLGMPRLSIDTDRDLYAGTPVVVDALRQLCYVTAVMLLGMLIVTFTFVNLMPTFQTIFADFDMQLPPLTRWVVNGANFLGQRGWILAPLPLVLLIALILALVYYIGWLNWEPYPLSRLLLPNHSRHILRTLAVQVEWQRPFPEAFEMMASSYPTAHVRNRLKCAAQHLRTGVPWSLALLQQRLIDAATRDVLESAERLGNLPWALREMADSRFRRYLRRVTVLLRILEPTVILMYGAFVAVMCLAMMTPIVDLIKALT